MATGSALQWRGWHQSGSNLQVAEMLAKVGDGDFPRNVAETAAPDVRPSG